MATAAGSISRYRAKAGGVGFSCSRCEGKLREAGLGSAGKGGVSLKAARDKAAEGRAMLKAGGDPIAEWNKPAAEEVPTFGKMADAFLDARKDEWRNEKHKRAMDDDVDALLRGDPQAAR